MLIPDPSIVKMKTSNEQNRFKFFAVSFKSAGKDQEFAVNDQFGVSLIFGPKIPFGELLSKIIFKSSSDFLILRDSQKFAVKVRFFGQLKVQNKVRGRSTAKCLK